MFTNTSANTRKHTDAWSAGGRGVNRECVRSYKVSVSLCVCVRAINKEMVSEKLNVRQININKKYYVDLCCVYIVQ